MKLKLIFNNSFLILILTIFNTHIKAQDDSDFHDFDSVKRYRYDDFINHRTPLRPPPPNSLKKNIKGYKK
jgi:hypothetical protein